MFGGVEGFVAGGFADGDDLLRGFGVVAVDFELLLQDFVKHPLFVFIRGPHSTRRNTNDNRVSLSGACFIAFSARTRAASVQVRSLSVVSACSGVLVTLGFTRHAWREDASNMFAGPTVRRQKV